MREVFLLFDDHVIICRGRGWGGGGCVEVFYTLWVCIANRFHITAVVRWIVYILIRLKRSLLPFRGWWRRHILLCYLLGGNLRIQPWFSTTKKIKKWHMSKVYIYKYLMVFFFKLLLLNLLKLMEEIKKLKTNKILGKYTGRVIHLLIGWRMNSLLGEKEEMEERKR